MELTPKKNFLLNPREHIWTSQKRSKILYISTFISYSGS